MSYIRRMTKGEFRAALDVLEMSQTEFARMIGIEARTSRRYALGETPVPGAVSVLLRLLLARPELKDVLEDVIAGESRERANA